MTKHEQPQRHEHHAGHTHGAGLARAGERHRGRLLVSFALIGLFFFVEAIAGFLTGSLALLSDAGHMLTDVVGLGMALAAIQLATRSARRHDRAETGHTFGLYRLEILAAFVNAMLLFAVAIWVTIEAIRRLFDEPEVTGVPMLIVAAVGLVVNLIAFALLRSGSAESLNVRGAYLEVAADTISSAGVILAAALVAGFGWTWADPVVAMLIGLWILPRTWQLGRQAVRILLQAAPAHVDLAKLTRGLAGIDGVCDVHDLHVWTLTSDMDAASAHLVVRPGTDHHAVLDQARHLLSVTHHIDHATFQIEPDDHEGCATLDW